MTDSLFGGSKQSQQSTSGNNAFNALSTSLTPQINNGTAANNASAALLGVGGDPAAAQTGLNNYLNSSGYKFQLGQGSDAITGNAAAKGLLNSGSTLKALDTFGQNIGSTYFGNYLNQLNALNTSGNQAAGIVSSAGQYSNSSGSGHSQNGILTSLFG